MYLETINLEDIAKRLTPISWDILQLLSKADGLSCIDIKNKLKLSQGKYSIEIARLEGGLLVDSTRGDTDKRYSYYKPTDNGLNILKYRR